MEFAFCSLKLGVTGVDLRLAESGCPPVSTQTPKLWSPWSALGRHSLEQETQTKTMPRVAFGKGHSPCPTKQGTQQLYHVESIRVAYSDHVASERNTTEPPTLCGAAAAFWLKWTPDLPNLPIERPHLEAERDPSHNSICLALLRERMGCQE